MLPISKWSCDRWPSVVDYGAVGNGTADDTAAIASAITAAGVNGLVLFPKGNYRVTSLTPLAGQTFRGNALGVLIYATGGNSPVFDVRVGNTCFDSIQIAHFNAGVNTDAVCVKTSGVLNSTHFVNCWLSNGYAGLKAVGGGDVSLIGCTVESMANGIWLIGPSQVRINGCWIGLSTVGLRMESNGGAPCAGVAVMGGGFTAIQQNAIHATGVQGLTVTGCTVQACSQESDNTHDAITLSGCTGVSIVGNTARLNAESTGRDARYQVYIANDCTRVELAANSWFPGKTAETYLQE